MILWQIYNIFVSMGFGYLDVADSGQHCFLGLCGGDKVGSSYMFFIEVGVL